MKVFKYSKHEKDFFLGKFASFFQKPKQLDEMMVFLDTNNIQRNNDGGDCCGSDIFIRFCTNNWSLGSNPRPYGLSFFCGGTPDL